MSFRRRIGSSKLPRGISGGGAGSRVYVSTMSLARAAPATLLTGLLVAPCLGLAVGCGERAGDPVVALPATSGAGGMAEPGPDAGGGAGESDAPATGPGGLCAPCESSSECGDANDACLRRDDVRFCGRDCDEQRDCPDGYDCVQLNNTQLLQCVPQGDCPPASPPPPELADLRQYVLSRVNATRADLDLDPLEPNSCLNQLAQDSAVDFARTDEPGGKYVKECAPIWPGCACGWSSEAEATVSRYGLDWQTAIDGALSPYGPNDRFVQGYTQSGVTGVGIGFWLSGDEAWVALSFQ